MTKEGLVSLFKTFQFNIGLGSFGIEGNQIISFVPESNYEALAKAVLDLSTTEKEKCECEEPILEKFNASHCYRCHKPYKPQSPELPEKLNEERFCDPYGVKINEILTYLSKKEGR